MNALQKASNNEDTVTRVYDAIKQQVTHCHFEPGERLNIETVAESLDVSATPVRETFNRLVAEDLLELVPRIGFFMKPIVEGAVRELYELNYALLNWALDLAGSDQLPALRVGQGKSCYLRALPTVRSYTPEILAKITGQMFHNLTLLSGNHELLARVDNISDRLFYVRKIEATCSERPEQKILPLLKAIDDQDFEQARIHLVEYHNECLLVLRNVVKTLRMSSVTRQQSATA